MTQEVKLETLANILANRHRGPRPEDATSIYTVRWCLRSDTFDGYGARLGSSSTPTKLHNHKTFITKDKAEALKKEIDKAFITLGYGLEGVCTIEEDWYE